MKTRKINLIIQDGYGSTVETRQVEIPANARCSTIIPYWHTPTEAPWLLLKQLEDGEDEWFLEAYLSLTDMEGIRDALEGIDIYK